MSYIITRGTVLPLFNWLDRLDSFCIYADVPRMREELAGIVDREMKTKGVALSILEGIVARWRAEFNKEDLADNGLSAIMTDIRNRLAPETFSFCPADSAASACASSSMYRPSPLRQMSYPAQPAISASSSSSKVVPVARKEPGQLERELEQAEQELEGIITAVSHGRGGEVFKCKLESRYLYLKMLQELQSQRARVQGKGGASSPILRTIVPEEHAVLMDVPPLWLNAEERENVDSLGVLPVPEDFSQPQAPQPYSPDEKNPRLEEAKRSSADSLMVDTFKNLSIQEESSSSSSAAPAGVERMGVSDPIPLRDITFMYPSSCDEGKMLTVLLEAEITTTQDEVEYLGNFIQTCKDPEVYRLRLVNRGLYLEKLLSLLTSSMSQIVLHTSSESQPSRV